MLLSLAIYFSSTISLFAFSTLFFSMIFRLFAHFSQREPAPDPTTFWLCKIANIPSPLTPNNIGFSLTPSSCILFLFLFQRYFFIFPNFILLHTILTSFFSSSNSISVFFFFKWTFFDFSKSGPLQFSKVQKITLFFEQISYFGISVSEGIGLFLSFMGIFGAFNDSLFGIRNALGNVNT